MQCSVTTITKLETKLVFNYLEHLLLSCSVQSLTTGSYTVCVAENSEGICVSTNATYALKST